MKKRIWIILATILCLHGFSSEVKSEIQKPEEPDYAFITGGPYTQGKNVIQFIQANNLSNTYGGGTITRDLTGSLRTEWGFTDNLEADLILQLRDQWTTTGGSTTNQNGLGDTTFGLRYRFLREDFAPITLTFGPQVIIPTGDVDAGFSNGQLAVAWDLSMAKEWNRYFFNYASINYSTTPGVNDPTAGSAREFVLHSLTWGVAPAFKALEKGLSGGAHHDIHLFLEMGGTLGETLQAGTTAGSKNTNATYLLSPGIRYGYLSKNATLTEIGLAAPIGLNDNSADWGIIFQMQFECPL